MIPTDHTVLIRTVIRGRSVPLHVWKEKYSERIKEIDNLLTKELPSDVVEKLTKEKEKLQGII